MLHIHAAVGNTGSFMIRQGPFKYIAFGTYGPSWLKSYHPQLFNVEQDPYAAPCCRRFTVRKKEGLLCVGEGGGWGGGGLEREAASEWTHVAQCWVYACLPLP
eukprot:COSAG01_NODE_2600_length_7396_cov_35.648212_7_plen_103_part_00